MAEDLERLKAIRGGHRGVATKLIRQGEEILETTFLLTEDYELLFVIYQQLDTKLKTLNDGCLENDDLENEDLRPRKRRPRKQRPRKRRPRKR